MRSEAVQPPIKMGAEHHRLLEQAVTAPSAATQAIGEAASRWTGSFAGETFAELIQVNIRQHALESGCFVVSATAWLDVDQQARIMQDTGCDIGPISGGCYTAMVSPEGKLLGTPLRSGAGVLIYDLDFSVIDERKRLMDSRPLQSSGTAQPSLRASSERH